jgi:hypothetical protein
VFETYPKKTKYALQRLCKTQYCVLLKQQKWEQRDLNPPQRISSETAHRNGQSAGLQQVGAPVGHQLSANPLVVIPVQLEPAILPSYTILPKCRNTINQDLACLRARFRRRNFFLRHFHRWLPVFFQAREPRFMVNEPPTNHPYMRASG